MLQEKKDKKKKKLKEKGSSCFADLKVMTVFAQKVAQKLQRGSLNPVWLCSKVIFDCTEGVVNVCNVVGGCFSVRW